MPICPKCKKEIDYLRFSARVEHFGNFRINESGIDQDTNDWGDWDNIELACPECNETLFTDEDKAEKFLNEEDELKEIVKEKLNKIKQKKNGQNKSNKRI